MCRGVHNYLCDADTLGGEIYRLLQVMVVIHTNVDEELVNQDMMELVTKEEHRTVADEMHSICEHDQYECVLHCMQAYTKMN